MRPPRIYLQVFGDSSDTATPLPATAWGEVTWSVERIFPGDVEYIAASVLRDPAAVYEMMMRGELAWPPPSPKPPPVIPQPKPAGLGRRSVL